MSGKKNRKTTPCTAKSIAFRIGTARAFLSLKCLRALDNSKIAWKDLPGWANQMLSAFAQDALRPDENPALARIASGGGKGAERGKGHAERVNQPTLAAAEATPAYSPIAGRDSPR